MEAGASILLAYDGSDDAANAIAVAGALLRSRRALVAHVFEAGAQRLLHSGLPGLSARLEDLGRELAAAETAAAERIAAAGVELAESAGFQAEPLTRVDAASAWHGVLELASDHGASAVVAGSRGRSSITSALLGSVSNGLLHHSRLPVLIVPPQVSREALGGPALLCYDDSAPAKHAIEIAAPLVSKRDAIVLHLWESWLERAHGGLAAAVVHGMARELEEIAAEQSGPIVEAGTALAQQSGFDARGKSERCERSLWRGLLDAADEHDASLIVLGSLGDSGISSVLGSVSNGVVHHSHRPVLVVPPAADY